MFELGAAAALAAELPGWSPHRCVRIVGTSAGAVVGALLAFGVDPAGVPDALASGASHPLAFRRGQFSRFPWGTHLRSAFRRRLSAGAFTNAGIEELVRRVAAQAGREDRFEALPVPLRVVATELDRGERVVFGEDGSVPVSAAVRASGAIPVYFEPVSVGNRDFIDGQILDPLHLDLAAVTGVRRIVAVSALTVYRRPADGVRVRSLGPGAISDQSARVAAAVKLAAARERLAREHPGIAVDLIAPEASEVGTLLRTRFSRDFATAAWKLGYEAALRTLRTAREGILECMGETST
jgi:predicted acylesterase/phospholipase RssA